MIKKSYNTINYNLGEQIDEYRNSWRRYMGDGSCENAL